MHFGPYYNYDFVPMWSKQKLFCLWLVYWWLQTIAYYACMLYSLTTLLQCHRIWLPSQIASKFSHGSYGVMYRSGKPFPPAPVLLEEPLHVPRATKRWIMYVFNVLAIQVDTKTACCNDSLSIKLWFQFPPPPELWQAIVLPHMKS